MVIRDDDSSHLSTGEISSNTGSDQGEQCGFKEFEKYARKESKSVDVWRELSIGILIFVCLFVCLAVFVGLSHQDVNNFRIVFKAFAENVDESVKAHDRELFESFTTISESITIEAEAQSNRRQPNWPLITIPYFEVYGAHVRVLSHVEFIAFTPIVQEHLETSWEMYALKNRWWVEESYDIQKQQKQQQQKQQLQLMMQQTAANTTAPINSEESPSSGFFSRHIYRLDDTGDFSADLGPGPYAPIWQISPPPPSSQNTTLINFDALSNSLLNQLYVSMIQSKDTVISKAIDMHLLFGNLYPEKYHGLYSDGEAGKVYGDHQHQQQQLTDSTAVETESEAKSNSTDILASLTNNTKTIYSEHGPLHTLIMEPIFERFHDKKSSPIVAFLVMSLPWESYLDRILPNQKSGIIIVVENTCGQQLTYQVIDDKITFIGNGDLHDVHWDTYQEVIELFETKNTGHNHINSATTTSDLYVSTKNSAAPNIYNNYGVGDSSSQTACAHNLYLYPSFELRSEYKQKSAGLFTGLIIISFFCMLLVFYTYEQRVSERNNKMVSAAARSNAIVSSLFPSNVRGRLFDQATNNNKNDGQKSTITSRFRRRRGRKKTKEGRRGSHGGASLSNSRQSAGSYGTRPRSTSFGGGAESRIARRGSVAEFGMGSNMLQNFLEDSGEYGMEIYNSKPIADLFPHTTVMFADIVGFTAWSSVREPSQVFMLLETLYRAFDGIAKRRRVFKVETIGDCYVAVAGLPEPRKDHAVVMCRFARNCLHRMYYLSKKLEVSLGPDTGDLSMRFGMHSGPTTAGVLRGERSRFQLFGDTVNTAARIESTGRRGRIHLSQETADLVCAAGKSSWVTIREDKVSAKGKGELTTYWLTVGETQEAEGRGSMGSSSGSHQNSVGDFDFEGPSTEFRRGSLAHTEYNNHQGSMLGVAVNAQDLGYESMNEPGQKSSTSPLQNGRSNHAVSAHSDVQQSNHKDPIPPHNHHISQKHQRLIDWNVQILLRLLRQIVARRNAAKQINLNPLHKLATPGDHSKEKFQTPPDKTVLEEVKEIIILPKFDSRAARNQEDPDTIEIDDSIVAQLEHFVLTIASLYRDNPFHNFEHASHVTMSVVKLLSRIVAPTVDFNADDADGGGHGERKMKKKLASKLHDHTYGITSDPLTQFAVVFSALIHDVDHTGVPNTQLVKENVGIATYYKGQSVAEQNSVDLSWRLLMNGHYSDLCSVICATTAEWERFRQLVVNSVMATDIVDKDLKALRNARWDKAFKSKPDSNGEEKANSNAGSPQKTAVCQGDDINRKATIVIEHLLQASDVSHTMQHWHIFRKWNERLFHEMYSAYKHGRAEKDPAEFWYKGEIGFFDFYIIPLAKKLKECGVFGVSHDEYLNYATHNRDEWILRGESVVSEMLASMRNAEEAPVHEPMRERRKKRLSLTG